ncbi:MAG: hypothetical protein ABSB56_04495 [Nitrososphaerales archaeon]
MRKLVKQRGSVGLGALSYELGLSPNYVWRISLVCLEVDPDLVMPRPHAMGLNGWTLFTKKVLEERRATYEADKEKRFAAARAGNKLTWSQNPASTGSSR